MKKQIVSGLLAASLFAASFSGTAFAAAVEHHPDLIFGDANVDGKINIKDATVMQMLLAEYKTDNVLDVVNDDSLLDLDGNRELSITDVKQLQRFVAGYPDETDQIGYTCYQWHDKEYAYQYPITGETLSDKVGYDSVIDYSAEPVGSKLLSDEGYRDVRPPIGKVTEEDCVGLNLGDLFGKTDSFPSDSGIETVPTEKEEQTTGFIPALPGRSYQLTAIANANVFGVSLYDDNKHFLERTQISGNRTTYTVDNTDARYIRITAWNNSLFSVTLVNGMAAAAGDWYSQPGVTDGFVNGIGDISEDKPEYGCVATDYIPVIAGDNIFEHTQTSGLPWMCIATYTPDKKFIKRITYTNTDFFKSGKRYSSFCYTVEDGVGYIRASCRTYTDGVHNLYIGDQQQIKEIFDSKVTGAINEIRALDAQGNLHAVNHRGFSSVAPENTLAAYKLSKKAGFRYVECDIFLTSDRVPVLLHDNAVDRTSNGTGMIDEMTCEEAKKLDFGSWKSPAFAGETIPTFEEFIRLCKNIGLHPYIELKPNVQFTQEDINSIVRTVNSYGMRGKVTYISIKPQWLEYVRNADEEARLGYVAAVADEGTVAKSVALLNGKNEVFIDANYVGLTEESVRLCIDAQVPLEVWATNTVASILNLPPYVSGATSDWLNINEVLYSQYIE